jgi:aminoglycoside phosphotransferase family enzyme/predicted kinase
MTANALVEALLQPAAYPERPTRVELRQTHISWVFLTDRFVYKVKKPVAFGFLDFTTLAARRFFCHEEVRLNRRLAPQVYLGVVEVKAEDGRIHIGGEGDIVDYAVHMRRLPEARMLPAMLAAGRVTPAMLQCLARLVAGFHAHAEAGPEVDQGGRLATVLANWQETFAQTRPYLDVPLPRELYERIRARVLAFCRTRASLFERRVAQGRIRDGHGDLRAEHICFTEPIAIFDGVEFNRRFRHSDVAADVAFLAMDLDALGFPELSQAFVQAYMASAGDPELAEVLDFYKCYRAFVRAKVECFRADDPNLSAAEQRAALVAARRYCQLAGRYAEALRRPWLLATCGLMGSGKSALAAALAQRLDLQVLSSDATRKQLAGLPPTAPAPDAYGDGLYSAAWTEATYARLFADAERLLAQGHSVLIDASFQRAQHRRQVQELAQRLGAEFCLLECWCPEAELQRRLQNRVARGKSVSDGRWELVAQQRRAFEPLFETPPSQHLRVDTTPPPEAVAAAVLQQLAQRGEVPWRASEGAGASSCVGGMLCDTRRSGGDAPPGEDDSRCRR